MGDCGKMKVLSGNISHFLCTLEGDAGYIQTLFMQ